MPLRISPKLMKMHSGFKIHKFQGNDLETTVVKGKGKVEVFSVPAMKAYGGQRYSSTRS